VRSLLPEAVAVAAAFVLQGQIAPEATTGPFSTGTAPVARERTQGLSSRGAVGHAAGRDGRFGVQPERYVECSKLR
jgi:hypothetical protein